jgi:[phosphatase 2A protein]-leucine-carboxy methyltransferase
VLYHELDFATNTQRKISTIVKSDTLKSLVGDPMLVRWAEVELHAPRYHIHSVDLRELDPSRPWTGPVTLNHIDPQLPTMLISECCLTYIAPEEADAVVRYFASKKLAPEAPVGIVLYEPINPFDSFGKVMVANLAARGIVMQTLTTYHSLDAQRARLATYGLTDGQRAVDMDFMLYEWLDDYEKRRISRVEMLDEVEELNLLAKHYCIAWAWRNGSEQFEGVWDRWKELEQQET